MGTVSGGGITPGEPRQIPQGWFQNFPTVPPKWQIVAGIKANGCDFTIYIYIGKYPFGREKNSSQE